MIRITVDGVEAVSEAIDLVTSPAAAARVIGAFAAEVHLRALDGADDHTKSGALLRSIRNVPVPGGRAVLADPSVAPHALFVHFGTRPHEIVPNKRKALRWSGGGAFHFARRVRHPGYRGDAFIYKAADGALRDFDAIVRRTLGKP